MILNVLPVAMQATAILGCNKKFIYIEYSETDTTINDIGVEVPVVTLQQEYEGSIQPVSNKMYEQMGLELNKNYRVVYCPALLQSIAEKTVTGQILYADRTWDIIENQNWWDSNGFTKCIICENKSLRNGDKSRKSNI